MKPKIFMDAFIRVRDGRGNPFASLRIDTPFAGSILIAVSKRLQQTARPEVLGGAHPIKINQASNEYKPSVRFKNPFSSRKNIFVFELNVESFYL